jgi:hypothetical protein
MELARRAEAVKPGGMYAGTLQWVGVGFHTDASVAGVETGDHLSERRIAARRETVVREA